MAWLLLLVSLLLRLLLAMLVSILMFLSLLLPVSRLLLVSLLLTFKLTAMSVLQEQKKKAPVLATLRPAKCVSQMRGWSGSLRVGVEMCRVIVCVVVEWWGGVRGRLGQGHYDEDAMAVAIILGWGWHFP